MELESIVLLLFLLVLLLSSCSSIGLTEDQRMQTKMSKNYYSVNEICPQLDLIYDDLETIRKEVGSIKDSFWPDWPEKELLESESYKWNIFPFKAFNVTVDDNCKKCPTLWSFLQKIPGLKIALLSRLGPGTKLTEHRGWGNHSNHVIRCHFGFKVPGKCFISVRENKNDKEEQRMHKENEWLLFDDSRYHYASNPTDSERIILIVDVERPSNVKVGVSTVGDTKELLQIIDYYKSKTKNQKN